MHADFHRRRVGLDELDAVADLLTASDLAVLGRADFTRAELDVDLRNGQIEHEGWYDDAGALVAYGWVTRIGVSAKIRLDAYTRPDLAPAVGAALLAGLEQRGRELAGEAGQDSADLDIGVYRQDDRTRAWMASRRFTVGTTFTRMRIDFGQAVQADPAPPPGVRLRRAEDTDADLALAHQLREQSFAEHYGHVPEPFDDFRARLLEHGPGWAAVWLADLDGEPTGLLVGTPQFVEDEDCGYVRTLGVAPAARGRGVARTLLLRYLADEQRAGRAGVLLHVDVANVTNALALYESVGMRPVLEIDAWAKQVAVTTAG